jgi:hypothetical protein
MRQLRATSNFDSSASSSSRARSRTSTWSAFTTSATSMASST